ncbi:MAG: hypothetical protein M3X11_07330 [Acidobacteriota bacterium]|nr:hypothetical protein [Acidobacteriota bacterium]
MTKEEGIRFKENWAAVNRLIIEEARRATLEERLRVLNSLYLSAQSFGWNEQLRAEEDDAIRERWQRLREKLGGAKSHGQEAFSA